MNKLDDIFINQDATIEDAIHVIDQTERKTAFVVDGRKLIGVVNEGDIRRSVLKGININDNVLKITNTDPITDVELAKKRIRYTSTDYIIVPKLDESNNITDCIIVTKDTEVSLTDIDLGPFRRILVIGGAGFLGSVLCEKLLKKGYKVRVLDILLYGDIGIQHLYDNPNFEFIHGDMRNIQVVVNSIKDVDAVIHLAAIVGDPASAMDPQNTIETNYFATKMVAEVCKYSQINRFIFASTCSVYGACRTPGSLLSENSPTNPVSLYADMKLKSENGLLEMADNHFSPTIFRMATLHGLSKRQRFDLVVNILAISAIHDLKFTIFGGEQYRALCHVEDAADMYIKCLELPISSVKSTIFNIVGENMSIKNLGHIVSRLVPEATMSIKKITDLRNYVVSSDKAIRYSIQSQNKCVIDTINDMKDNADLFKDFRNKKYSNVEFLSDK